MLKAIFWDNDGVLVDTERLYYEANRRILESEGIELTHELYRRHWLKSWTGLIAIGTEHGLSVERIDALRKQRDAVYSVLLETSDILVPEIESVLQQLPQRVVNGIVTSSKRLHFDIIHRRTGLLPYFQFVVAQGDYERSKPDPEPYLVAISRAEVSPESCLVIEDSERGLMSATAAGIRCWIIESQLTKGADFSKAEKVLSNAGEIPALLATT